MNTTNYEYMLAIAEEGTILAAAERLHISQSALSQALAKEEQEAGGSLFERSRGKKITVTPLGELYLRTAADMIRIKKETYVMIERMSHNTAETIRIGICNQAYNTISDTILTRLKKRFPDLNIFFYKTDSSQSLTLLKNGSVDLAILAAVKLRDNVLETARLYQEHLVLAISEGYTINSKDPLLKQLAGIPFIYPGSDTFMNTLIPEEMKPERLNHPSIYRSGDAEEILRMVENGYGAGLIPAQLVSSEHTYTVIELEHIPYYDIMIAMPKYSRNKANLTQVFREISTIQI